MIKEILGLVLSDNELSLRYRKFYIAVAGLVFFLARIAGDILLSKLNVSNDILVIWQSITSLIITGTIAIYIFSEHIRADDDNSGLSSDDFMKELSSIIALMFILIAVNWLLPDDVEPRYISKNVFSILLVGLTAIYGTILGLLTYKFLYKWFNIRKHKKTSSHLKILVGLLAFATAIESINYIFEFESNVPASFINAILFTSAAAITFLSTKKNNWISSIPKSSKVKLFWLCFFGMGISLMLTIMSMQSGTKLNSAFSNFVIGSSIFAGFSFFILMFYLARLFFATIASLPASDIMERKTSEITSLTYLNSYIAASVNQDTKYLLDTVTKLALDVCEAGGAWAETYDNGEVNIASSQNIDIGSIKNVHTNLHLKNYLQQIEKPHLVESVPENGSINFLAKLLPIAQSIIVIPLFSGNDRFGTLIVANPEEYGLDHDDVKVIAAFSDNVNVALENSRLFKDSLEKEKYKNELLLARTIQQKLLPQQLPIVKNYSISAFTLPAAEVGGDYYDVVYLENGNPCILIGDVSGKGISAAFYMAQLKGIVLSHAPLSKSPADLLKKINHTLYGSMEKQMYITLSALSLNNDFGNITISRAGHMPIFIKSNNFVSMYIPKGLGVGLVDSPKFNESIEEIELDLNSGDSCLLFTDGVNELNTYNNNQLGYEPLREILIKHHSKDAADLTENLMQLISLYPEKNSQHDDMTVVGLVYLGENGNKLRA